MVIWVTEYWIGYYHGLIAMFVARLVIDIIMGVFRK